MPTDPGLIEATLNKAQSLLEGLRSTWRRRDLEGMLDEAIERTLRRLRIPSRHDIDRINERLDRIQSDMKRSNGSVKTPARTRKAAR